MASLPAGLAAAAEVNLDVNNSAAKLLVGVPLSNNLLVDGAWLYHADNGHVLSAAGHITGAASGVDPLQGGLGLRLSYIINDRESEEDGAALALGGFLRYTLPQYDRIHFSGSLYYAPEVLSFSDVDEYYEYGLDAGYSVLKNADVYLGWRTVKADFKNDGTERMDTGFHVGFRARF
jgi:hypothetical protein